MTSGVFILKILKLKVPQWLWIPTTAIWLDSIQNLSHMLLIFTLSFVKLLWPLLRFSPCTHDQDSRTPTNKMLTLTLRVTQKHVIFCPPNKNSIHLSWVLLSKVFICQKKVWGYAKKERETHEALKIAKEKEKKYGTHEGSKCWKERNKDSPYF